MCCMDDTLVYLLGSTYLVGFCYGLFCGCRSVARHLLLCTLWFAGGLSVFAVVYVVVAKQLLGSCYGVLGGCQAVAGRFLWCT